MENMSLTFPFFTSSHRSDLSSCFICSSVLWLPFLICACFPPATCWPISIFHFKLTLCRLLPFEISQSVNQSLCSYLFLLTCLPPFHPDWMENPLSVLIIAKFSVPKSVIGTPSTFNNYLVNVELKNIKFSRHKDFKAPKLNFQMHNAPNSSNFIIAASSIQGCSSSILIPVLNSMRG